MDTMHSLCYMLPRIDFFNNIILSLTPMISDTAPLGRGEALNAV